MKNQPETLCALRRFADSWGFSVLTSSCRSLHPLLNLICMHDFYIILMQCFFAALALAVHKNPCYTLTILVDILLVIQAGSDGTTIFHRGSIPREIYRVLLGLFLLPSWTDGKRQEKGRHLLHEKLQAARNRRAASGWRRKERRTVLLDCAAEYRLHRSGIHLDPCGYFPCVYRARGRASFRMMLVEKYDGWINRQSVKDFERYTRFLIEKFGEKRACTGH